MYVVQYTNDRGAARANFFGVTIQDGQDFILPADRCVWRQVNNIVTTATDTGYTVTSASPTSITISEFGNFRAEFPVGTMISPNADGSAAVAVTSTSYSGTSDRTAISMVGGTFAISSKIYIVTQAVDGYQIQAASAIVGGDSPANSDVRLDAVEGDTLTLGFLGKSGRFVPITVPYRRPS